jgi:hypothetical protein
MRQPAQQFIASVFVHNRLTDDGTQPRHPRGKPSRHMAGMQWQIRTSRSVTSH